MGQKNGFFGFFFALTLLVGLVSVDSGGVAWADERIRHFHSDIQVLEDGTLHVREIIKVTAEGDEIKRGIFREIPNLYTTKYGVKVRLPLDVLKVSRDGKKEPYHIKDMSNGVRIYCGEEEVQLKPGKYTYEIIYTTNFQVGYFHNHDELYWNVTGNGWTFPIDQVSARVVLPEDVPREKMQLEAYTGPQNSKGSNYISMLEEETDYAIFATTKKLKSKEGLTIVVSFPKGFVREPTAAEKSQIYEEAIWSLGTMLVGVLVILVYYLIAWIIVGRDPPGETIYPRFEPPMDLPPACMRYLRQMSYDKKSFTAALVNLAVKGYVEINDKDGVYTVRRAHGSTNGRPSPGEKKLMRELLKGGSIELKQSNHETIASAIKGLGERLSLEYDGKLFAKNRNMLVPGWILSVLVLATSNIASGSGSMLVSIFLAVILSGATACCVAIARKVVAAWQGALLMRKISLRRAGLFVSAIFMTIYAVPFFVGGFIVLTIVASGGTIWMIPLFIAIVGINWGFWHWMKQPTVEGQRVRDQIEGFRMYLGTAEGEYLQTMHPPELTPELFEKYLPYALALGVENAWAEQFARQLKRAAASPDEDGYHPTWYIGSDWSPDSM